MFDEKQTEWQEELKRSYVLGVWSLPWDHRPATEQASKGALQGGEDAGRPSAAGPVGPCPAGNTAVCSTATCSRISRLRRALPCSFPPGLHRQRALALLSRGTRPAPPPDLPSERMRFTINPGRSPRGSVLTHQDVNREETTQGKRRSQKGFWGLRDPC